MRVTIKPEQQIQRINKLLSYLESTKERTDASLNHRTNEKSWSALETAKHISMGHKAYQPMIDATFSNSKGTKVEVDQLRCSYISSLLMKRFAPVDKQIKFKMKTMKKFQPIFDHDAVVDTKMVIAELEACLNELKSWVNNYRTNPISLKKFNSAVGAVVRFNIPEACEFILCHNERHFSTNGELSLCA